MCYYFCRYFYNTVNFFDNLAINFNRYFKSNILCDYLLNLNFFYDLFLYLSDNIYLYFFYHFSYNFFLYFYLFLDEAIDVHRNFFLNLSYHFFLDINWYLLLDDPIPLHENRFLYLLYLFHYHWFLNLDSYFTYYFYFYFDRYFLYYFDYLLLLYCNLFDYLKRNLLLYLFNHLFFNKDYLLDLNRDYLLYDHLSYHLYLFDNYNFLDNLLSYYDFNWNLYNLGNSNLILVFKIYLSWYFYDVIHLFLYDNFIIDEDLSCNLDYLYIFKILLN